MRHHVSFSPMPLLIWRCLLILFLLYSIFVLYPSYTSGLATFTGDPQSEWEGPLNVPYMEGSFAFFLFYPVFSIYVLGRLGIIPLALALLLRCGRSTKPLVPFERWLYIGTSVLTVSIMVATWSAGPPFIDWWLD